MTDIELIAELPDSREQKGVVAWARPVYAPESADEMVDVEFHLRPEKPEMSKVAEAITHPCTPKYRESQLRAKEWEVRPAPLAAARQLVEQHHYARGASNTAVYVHGLYHRGTGQLHGVVWWLPPTRVAAESVNKAEWQRVLSLSRMVMLPDTPANACSFLLARSIRIIRRDRRFISLVTYADESVGHAGGVYRAANWNYVGRTGPYPKWIDPTSGRQVATKATKNRTKSQMQQLGYQCVGSFHKHKFVLHLE